jgi:hypothetical protein
MTLGISDTIRKHLGRCPRAGSAPAYRTAFEIPETAGIEQVPLRDPEPVRNQIDGGIWYRHTQPNLVGGRKTTCILIAFTLVMAAAIVFAPVPVFFRPVFLLLGLLALANAAFSSLTVVLTQDLLEFWFGAGIWHRKYRLISIARCSVVRNAWWHGWGIRWTPDGWLYNVAGPDAVAILFTDGRKIRIGTDEPGILCDAISTAIAGKPLREGTVK